MKIEVLKIEVFRIKPAPLYGETSIIFYLPEGKGGTVQTLRTIGDRRFCVPGKVRVLLRQPCVSHVDYNVYSIYCAVMVIFYKNLFREVNGYD